MTTRPFDDCMPCPRCGAHVWLAAGLVYELDAAWTGYRASSRRVPMLRCDECNNIVRREAVQYPALVGRD